MNVLTYRDPPPPESSEDYYCLGCGELHPFCICDDLPSYEAVRDHPSEYLHLHAGAK
jgi:hypothetical protein